MKKLLLTIITACSFAACASQQQYLDKKFLIGAGYHAETPSTPQQKAQYAALPAYKLLWNDKKPGETIYKDAKTGVIYRGNETEYRLYLQLAFAEASRQQHALDAQMQALDAQQVDQQISNLRLQQDLMAIRQIQPPPPPPQFYRPVYTQPPQPGPGSFYTPPLISGGGSIAGQFLHR
jgi:hypothetical protein